MKKRKRERLNEKNELKKIASRTSIYFGKKEPPGTLCQKLTEEWQNEIRHSKMWDEVIKNHGIDGAEELLKEFRAYVR
jgi:hypothetical protein